MNPLFDRALKTLPVAFEVADVVAKLGSDLHGALRLLSEWEAKRYVRAVGASHYIKVSEPIWPDWEAPLRSAMPSATLIGVEPLRRAGWITQITWFPAVAIRSDERLPAVEHFNVVHRPLAWFEAVAPGLRGGESGTLLQLAPAWALADMIARGGWRQCCLDPDDIYWDDVTEADQEEWREACVALGLGRVHMNPDRNDG